MVLFFPSVWKPDETRGDPKQEFLLERVEYELIKNTGRDNILPKGAQRMSKLLFLSIGK